MIKNRETFLKKFESRKKKNFMLDTLANSQMSKNDNEASEQGIITIPEYKFAHGIFKISSNEMNPDGLQYAFGKLSYFLDLKKTKTTHFGLTIVVGPQWMFLATLNQAYHEEMQSDGRKLPVYLDGLAYAGVVNIQDIKQKWPCTAGHGYEEHPILNSLKYQSTDPSAPDEIDDWLDGY